MIKSIIIIFLFPLLSFGKNIKVLEIDTGIEAKSHERILKHVKDDESENYIDTHGHGTHIAGIILKNTCKEVELISCKFYFGNKSYMDKILDCFQKALTITDLKVINFSAGGKNYSDAEYQVLKQLSDKGIKIVVSIGNNNLDLSVDENNFYPAKYKGIKNLIVVGNLNNDGYKSDTSNYGIENMIWEKGEHIFSTLPAPIFYGELSGTSQAAAIKTNKILKEECKNE
jgi:subtilisin family serine protease